MPGLKKRPMQPPDSSDETGPRGRLDAASLAYMPWPRVAAAVVVGGAVAVALVSLSCVQQQSVHVLLGTTL